MSTDVVSDPAPLDPADVPGPGPGADSAPQGEATDPAPISVATQYAANADSRIDCAKPAVPNFLNSPPDSNNATKSDASDSELSELEEEPILDDIPSIAPAAVEGKDDLDPKAAPAPTATEQIKEEEEEEEDIGEVLPHDWSGAVPIFRPTWHQFKDFKKFMKKVDCYGMKSGIIKIIPPKEWKDAQPPLDDLVKHIRVREPIKQDIMGSNGTYRQVNILHGRSYNIPQWRQLCEQSEHQPPARRGERRANADKPKASRPRPAAPKAAKPATPKKRGRGRPAKNKGKKNAAESEERPMTPVSPKLEVKAEDEMPVQSIEQDIGDEIKEQEDEAPIGRMGGRMGGLKSSRPKTQSVSARRKYSRREGSAMIDEAAFKDFDYKMDISDYTPERCEELERAYWKTLTYAPPLYGADMMGTLFDDRTETWNLNKLPNLLDVLGTKIPGVNTAYLYLGMWKATFAWHLEDVDLYSINYLHFGAPKQWYSISQADARRFEGAMKSVWPADAKACSQFLRHKGFLISPHHLLQHYGIKVNKVVSYPGEFVVTYPYGYHSGYNLGYNCAEAVNFALDTWLEMGKIAKRCECAQAQDSVWINVYEIERKLRGEETEFEETDDEDDEEDDDELSGLPTPPASHGVKFKDATRKRKRGLGEAKVKAKKIRLRLKTKAEPPCCLCPNDISQFDILPTEDGRKAHRLCALYTPETYIDSVDGKEVVYNVANVDKDRLDLKCLFCRSKRGACFQCSQTRCTRAYHASCAAAAGVFVEDQEVPVFDEQGTEYKEQAFEFSCRFHRARRDKKIDNDVLEADSRIRAAAKELKSGQVCQMQYLRGDIFAGVVVENRNYEETLLVDILPHGDRIEVEWKWLLLPDPSDYHLPKASAKALPLPASHKAKERLNTKRLDEDKPRKNDVFVDGYTWAEFELLEIANKLQVKVDFSKPDQLWYYLGKTSTEARAQYTEDTTQQRHNPKSNFLTVNRMPARAAPVPKSNSTPAYRSQLPNAQWATAHNHTHVASHQLPHSGAVSFEKPYVYKPKDPAGVSLPVVNNGVSQSSTSFAADPPTTATTVFHSYNHHISTFPQQQYPAQAISQTQSKAHYVPQAQTKTQHDGQFLAKTSNLSNQQPGNAQSSQSKPVWQVHSSIYQRYPFFQVNHNRDASGYRTPYSPWGGFTNGYEINRAHLSAPHDATQRSSFHSVVPAQETCRQPAPSQVPKNQPRQSQTATPFKVGLPAAVNLSLQATKVARAAPAKVTPVPLPQHVLATMGHPTKASDRPPPQQLASHRSTSVSGPTVHSQAAPASTASNGSPAQSLNTDTAKSSGQQWQNASGSYQVPPATSPDNPHISGPPGQSQGAQEFADVPGSESMQFVERMMQNLRRASLNEPAN